MLNSFMWAYFNNFNLLAALMVSLVWLRAVNLENQV